MIRAPFMSLGFGVALTAALLVGAGCKKAAKPPTDAAPITVDAAALATDAPAAEPEPGPLTPPVPAGKVGVQVLGVEYEGYEAKLLPAIRGDGAQFAALWIGDDGGRGYLDLKLQLLDAKTSATVDDRRLVDPDETMAAQGEDGRFDPKMLEAVVKRVADANALFASGDWRALKSHTADPADPDVPIVAAGITWTLDTKYRLVGTRAGKKVFERTYTQLTRKQPPRDHVVDDEMCPVIITLSAIHVDEASSQALVAFGRQPGHNCGAPGDDLAVIALPR
jgi:hypothetical protein